MMHGVRVRNVLSQDLWHKDWKTKPCCKRLPTSARAGQIDGCVLYMRLGLIPLPSVNSTPAASRAD